MKDKFRITIASLPDRENLVAEIVYDGYQWAEIAQETNEMTVQFYSSKNAAYWEFTLDEAIEALNRAKERLISMDHERQ